MTCDKIISDKNCNTIVVNEEFLFPYIYVYILQLNKVDGTTLSQTFIRDKVGDEIKFTIGQNGFYTLCRLKILRNDLDKDKYFTFQTLQEKFDNMDLEEQQQFCNGGIVYYEDGKFYYKKPKNDLNQIREITVQEIVQINHTITNVDTTYYYYFQVCKLRACYNALAQKVLDERSNIKCNGNKVNSEDIYLRDLVWSALNTILYMAEQDQFEEAARLLESIVGCNGLCKGEDYSNCGCEK